MSPISPWYELREGEEFETIKALWEKNLPDAEVPRLYRHNAAGLQVLLNREPTGEAKQMRWHLSMSHMDRVPTWEEMVYAVHSLRPGVPFVMGIPPKSWWMNVHPHTLHAWETFDWALVDEWKRNARGDTPT